MVSGQLLALAKGHATRTAVSLQPWHRLPACDLTQMLTCCLDAVAHGGNPLFPCCIAYSKADS
ncbi:hypothetical protein [Moorena producens]|uniref:hypothetical protein n=1 Tax=Moorena producens TaxID=1155739 RepID=UPI0011EA6F03|nr:hypothetical protein [Moorena producens]